MVFVILKVSVGRSPCQVPANPVREAPSTLSPTWSGIDSCHLAGSQLVHEGELASAVYRTRSSSRALNASHRPGASSIGCPLASGHRPLDPMTTPLLSDSAETHIPPNHYPTSSQFLMTPARHALATPPRVSRTLATTATTRLRTTETAATSLRKDTAAPTPTATRNPIIRWFVGELMRTDRRAPTTTTRRRHDRS